jgi:MFS family permease
MSDPGVATVVLDAVESAPEPLLSLLHPAAAPTNARAANAATIFEFDLIALPILRFRCRQRRRPANGLAVQSVGVRLLPPGTDADAGVLIGTRGTRGFVDGLVSVALAAYLPLIGFSQLRIGVLVTAMLLGSAATTLLVGTKGHAWPRRTLLFAGSGLMITTGLGFALTTTFAVLMVVGFIGTMNPTSGDVSVFLPLEQAMVSGTTPPVHRTALFARYAFIGGIAAAFGSLAVRIPETVADHTSITERAALRACFVIYALAGVVLLVSYRSLHRAPRTTTDTPTKLGPSRHTVYKLAALFSLDAFGGGFVVQSLLALWLFQRFDMSVGAAGTLLFVTGTLAAASGFVASWLAGRIGLVKTMVFTHLPANMLLIATPFMPTLQLALVCLVLRSLLSSMDVPARTSYVMAVVSPAERAAAASVTNVPRSLAAAMSPAFAGWMLGRSSFGWPLVIAGVSKALYDLLLLLMFEKVKPPEELDPAQVDR